MPPPKNPGFEANLRTILIEAILRDDPVLRERLKDPARVRRRSRLSAAACLPAP